MEHYPLLGPGTGLANSTQTRRGGGMGQLLRTSWSSRLGEGAKETAKEERPNLVAISRSGWESTSPLQLQHAGMLMGVPSPQRG